MQIDVSVNVYQLICVCREPLEVPGSRWAISPRLVSGSRKSSTSFKINITRKFIILCLVGINFSVSLHKFITTSLFSRLKLECEKLAQDKTEMQRHYVMVS